MGASHVFDWKDLFQETVKRLINTAHPLEQITRTKSEESIRDLLVGHMLSVRSGQVILSESHHGRLTVSAHTKPSESNSNKPDILHFGNDFTESSIENPRMYVELKAAYNGDFSPAPGRNAQKPWASFRNQKDSIAFFNDTRRLFDFKQLNPETVCLQGLIVCYNVNCIYPDKNLPKHKNPNLFGDAFANTFEEDGLRQAWLTSTKAKLKTKAIDSQRKGKKITKDSREMNFALEWLSKASPKVLSRLDLPLTDDKEGSYWIRLYLFELGS